MHGLVHLRAAMSAFRRASTARNRLYVPSTEVWPPAVALAAHPHDGALAFGATSYDVATYGFEDLQLYRELATGAEQRSLPEVRADQPLRSLASDVLRNWAEN